MLVLFFVCQYCRLAAPYESDGQQPQTAETVVVNFDPQMMTSCINVSFPQSFHSSCQSVCLYILNLPFHLAVLMLK